MTLVDQLISGTKARARRPLRSPHTADELDEIQTPVFLAPDRYVTIAVQSVISGLTQKAIRRKIEDGVWVEGREYIRAPDERIYIDREGVQRWLTRGA